MRFEEQFVIMLSLAEKNFDVHQCVQLEVFIGFSQKDGRYYSNHNKVLDETETNVFDLFVRTLTDTSTCSALHMTYFFSKEKMVVFCALPRFSFSY